MPDDIARGEDGAFYREFEMEGQKGRAAIVPITTAEEHWSTLLLANGATLRMKAVVKEGCVLEGPPAARGASGRAQPSAGPSRACATPPCQCRISASWGGRWGKWPSSSG